MTDTPGASAQLTATRIQFTDAELGWREAIQMVGQPLVAEGAVTDNYVATAIAIAEEKGPFFDLGRGVAMPHARPEAGVNEIALSYLRCRKPVLLLDRDDHPIDVFIMLAATDSKSHLKVLRKLAGVLTDPDAVQQLKDAATPDEVLALLATD